MTDHYEVTKEETSRLKGESANIAYDTSWEGPLFTTTKATGKVVVSFSVTKEVAGKLGAVLLNSEDKTIKMLGNAFASWAAFK